MLCYGKLPRMGYFQYALSNLGKRHKLGCCMCKLVGAASTTFFFTVQWASELWHLMCSVFNVAWVRLFTTGELLTLWRSCCSKNRRRKCGRLQPGQFGGNITEGVLTVSSCLLVVSKVLLSFLLSFWLSEECPFSILSSVQFIDDLSMPVDVYHFMSICEQVRS